MHWGYFILGVIAYQFLKMLAIASNNAVIERRQKKFLNLMRIEFPDASFTFIAIDSSDKRSMDKLEREIRENFDLTDDEARDAIGNRDRGVDRGVRDKSPRHRKGPTR